MRLRKGMPQDQVNKLLQATGYNLNLHNEEYFGNNTPHDWVCQCGDLILNRKFSKIKGKKATICKKCQYQRTEEKYKQIVEQEPDYIYIRSFRSGEIIETPRRIITVGDSPYIEVHHKPCKRTYKITFGGFNQGKRCPCAPFEKSVKALFPDISELIHSDPDGKIIDDEIKGTIHAYSDQRYYFKCKDCGEISDKCLSLHQVTNEGYSCKYCSDGISLPEKFVIQLLTYLNIRFSFHKSFKWSQNKIYDFFIPHLKLIIEVHGIQHYEESPRGSRTLKEEQENDQLKMELALSNECNYVIIDCRKSSFKWLKENCIKELSHLFSLSDINWELIWENCQKSYVTESWALWNAGHSISEIAKALNLNQATIRRYLNAGSAINKCTYNSEEEKEGIKRKVICITTGKTYDSISSAAAEIGSTLKALHRCCNSRFKRLGKTESGEKLIWMYLDEYQASTTEDIEALKNAIPPTTRKVMCITTGMKFNSPREAAEYYNIERRNILSCCHGQRNHCGKWEGKPLQWSFII
jgi:hypothetical protein